MMEFPQYRKYKNNHSFFKIESDTRFIEYKLLGSKVERYSFEAKILPDRNYLNDMLYSFENHWDKMNEKEWFDFLNEHSLKE